MSGTSVLWTIPAEILFYIAFIPLWYIYDNKKGFFYLALIVIILFLVLLKFPRPKGDILSVAYDITLFRAMPFFIVGMIFGKLYTCITIPKYLIHNLYLVFISLFFILYPKIFKTTTGVNYILWVDIEILIILSIGFFGVVFLVPDDNIFLSNSIGDFLGKISYSLYLLHLPVLWQVKKFGFDSVILQLFSFIVLTLIASYLSYKFFENPSRRFLRSRFSKKSKKRGRLNRYPFLRR